MITYSSAEAQNRFGQLLDTVQREPVSITRHGRTAAYLVSERDMDELLDARRSRSKAVEDIAAWRVEARKHTTAEAAGLTDQDVVRLVHESR
jgi:prevent-host-death family protein